MLAWLSKPYPITSVGSKTIIGNALISAFVVFFLIVFQPFGLSESRLPDKNLYLAGYGIVCFAATSFTNIFLLIFASSKIEEKWTIGFEILWFLFVIFTISSFNLFYSIYLGFAGFNLRSFGVFSMYTMAIGIFPTSAFVFLNWHKLSAKNEKATKEINQALSNKPAEATVNVISSQLTLKAESGNEQISLVSSDLLYIESMDNYSAVHYYTNGMISKKLLRGSLKFMEAQLTADPQVLRCHRTFIVNLNNVVSAAGNAQGYKLQLKDNPTIIPVSRNYLTTVLEKFRSEVRSA